MKIINKDDIDCSLQDSVLYKELTENTNEITVQDNYLFDNLEINNNQQFYQKLNALRYWMVNNVPYEIYDYLIDHKVDISQYKDFNYKILSLFNNFTKNKHSIVNLIVKTGNLDLLKHLVDTNRIELNKFMYNEVVRQGQLEILKYIYEQLGKFDNYPHYYTCAYNQLECLKYICQHEEKIQKYINEIGIGFNVKKDNFKCLKYLHDNFDVKISDKTMECAIKEHNMEYVQFLEDKGLNTLNNATFELVDYAIRYNNLDILKIIYSRNPMYASIITVQQFHVAITNECIDCLKYLHELINFQPITAHVINSAIYNTTYYEKCSCIKYLAEKGNINKQIAYYYASICEDEEVMNCIKPKYTQNEIELMNKNMNAKFNIYDLSNEIRYYPGLVQRFKNISGSTGEGFENDYFKMACVPNAQGELVPIPNEIKFEDGEHIISNYSAINGKYFLIKELFDSICDYGEFNFSDKKYQTFFNRLIHKRDNVYTIGWKQIKINHLEN